MLDERRAPKADWVSGSSFSSLPLFSPSLSSLAPHQNYLSANHNHPPISSPYVHPDTAAGGDITPPPPPPPPPPPTHPTTKPPPHPPSTPNHPQHLSHHPHRWVNVGARCVPGWITIARSPPPPPPPQTPRRRSGRRSAVPGVREGVSARPCPHFFEILSRDRTLRSIRYALSTNGLRRRRRRSAACGGSAAPAGRSMSAAAHRSGGRLRGRRGPCLTDRRAC